MIDDPAFIGQFIDGAKKFTEGTRRISDKEKELTRIGNKDKLTDLATDLKKAKEGHGRRWRKPTAEQQAAMEKIAHGDRIPLDKIETELARIEASLAKADTTASELSTLETQITELRTGLIQEIAVAAGIDRIARDKAQLRLNELMASDPTLSNAEKLRGAHTKLKSARSGIDYLGGTPDSFGEDIDAHIEELITNDFREAVGEALNSDRTPFSQLEKTIQKLVRREKVGAKTGKEIAELALDILRDGETTASPVSAKRVRRAIINLERGYYR